MNNVKGIERLRAELRRVAFEALYSQFAWAYDWVSRTFFLGQWRVWQRAAIPHLKGHAVLEVGLGTGDMQVDLTRRGFTAWGIELSPQMLRQARRKARRQRIAPLRVCRARAQRLPFPDSSFNSAVATFPSDYIAEPQTLSELSRVLKPGGRLVVVPGGWLAPVDSKGMMLEWLAVVVYGGKSAPTGPAAKELTALDTEKLMSSAHWASGWVKLLNGRMIEAGFSVRVHVASNRRGAALVMVAEKPDSEAPGD